MYYTLFFAAVTAFISLSARLLMFFVPPERFQRWRVPLLSLSAGTFLGLVIFDLLPESFEAEVPGIALWILGGILLFFLVEKFLLGYHHRLAEAEEHHAEPGHIHPAGILVLAGDGLHNFLDGVAIAIAFSVSVPIGIATSISILLHEIPQEIGDVMVLLLSGFSRAKAFFWNFVFALTTVIGAGVTAFFLQSLEKVIPLLIAFTAGGFLYVAMSDLLPETKHHESPGVGLRHFLFLIIGIILIWRVGALILE
jgi:zinc and cadmium transporter